MGSPWRTAYKAVFALSTYDDMTVLYVYEARLLRRVLHQIRAASHSRGVFPIIRGHVRAHRVVYRIGKRVNDSKYSSHDDLYAFITL